MGIQKVSVYHIDDWTAVYIDGKLYAENHSIQDELYLEIIKRLGVTVFEEFREDLKSRFPEKEEDIPKPISEQEIRDKMAKWFTPEVIETFLTTEHKGLYSFSTPLEAINDGYGHLVVKILDAFKL